MTSSDLIAVALSAALVFGYHAWLIRRVRTAPAATAYGQAALARAAWIRSVMAQRRDILAVPALLWLFGPIWMSIGSVALCVGLFRMDQAVGNRRI